LVELLFRVTDDSCTERINSIQKYHEMNVKHQFVEIALPRVRWRATQAHFLPKVQFWRFASAPTRVVYGAV
jgi:hypothetical protein